MSEEKDINKSEEHHSEKETPKHCWEDRVVKGPDGDVFVVEPMKDYFSDEMPTVYDPKSNRVVENFLNWTRAESIWVLGFGTGCGGIEVGPLRTPRFDIFRYGVQWRATPRQSNAFIISGYLSIKTLKRAIRSYEQMPSPKYILALGSCTINGGTYHDSYNVIKRLDQYLPVDIYVAGCMPRPEAILKGFETLKKLIKEGKAEKANDYIKNIEWYKTNQKKVIKDWNMPDYNW